MTETFSKRMDGQTGGLTDILMALRELINEEQDLVLKRDNLIEIYNKLICMVRDEIEIRRKRIEGLRNEINELKFLCEEIANILRIPINK